MKTSRINLAEVGAKVVSRYVLQTQVETIVLKTWYDVAVGPFRKGGKDVMVIKMQAIEPFTSDLFVRMRNELGGIITVRKTDVLQKSR